MSTMTVGRAAAFVPQSKKEKDDGTFSIPDIVEAISYTQEQATRIALSISDVVKDRSRPNAERALPMAEKLFRRMYQEKLNQQGAEEGTVSAADGILTAIGGFIFRKVASSIARMAIRMLWQSVLWAGRTILMNVVRPIIMGVGGFLVANPLTSLIIGAVGVGGYYAWKTFFSEDARKPKVSPETPLDTQPDAQEIQARTAAEPKTSTQGVVVPGGAGAATATPVQAAQFSAVGSGTAATSTVETSYTPGQVSDKDRKVALSRLANRSQSVKDAIHEASRRVGVSETTLTAFAAIESNFNPDAGASTSSAKGLFQFITGTWKSVMNRFGKQFNVPADANIYDPLANAIMGAAFLRYDLYPSVSKVVPNPSATDLYMAHLLGPGGGSKFLRNMKANPNAIAANDFTKEAAANTPVFYAKGAGPRSYAQIYAMFAAKFQPIEAVANEELSGKTSVQAATAVKDKDAAVTNKPSQADVRKADAANDSSVGTANVSKGEPEYTKVKGKIVKVK